jgi:hypothetical protein
MGLARKEGRGDQLLMQIARVAREMPDLMAWLKDSTEETVQAACYSEGVEHDRRIGELRILREICGEFTDPRSAIPLDGTRRGMDG